MSDVTRAEFFEALERRVLLAYDPATFPALSDLASEDNTVIRFNTDLGFIDIELFDQAGPDGNANTAAPNTVANFLNYILDGDFDGTFFHRLDTLSPGDGTPQEILQGGAFTFTDEDGLNQIETDDPVANEFSEARSNIERTIAMAKLSGDPDSATSQFFFNLTDNSDALDDDEGVPDVFDNGGFTVFGRVANDASWMVLQSIAALEDFNFGDVESEPDGDEIIDPGSGQPTLLEGGDPLSLAFVDTPVDMSVMNVPPGELRFGLMNEAALVTLSDVEVIKTAETDEYYTRTGYYPEGFANDNIRESITVTNLDANEDVFFQVLLRYERGVARDQVIFNGMLPSNGTETILVHDGTNPVANPVQKNVPYSFEIQATSAVSRFGASILHEDFGSTGQEQFIASENFDEDDLTRWNFTTVEKRDGEVRSFILWQNLTAEDAVVGVKFFDPVQDGREIRLQFDLEPFRRGGVNVGALEQLPDGVYAVLVSSSQPMVVAHSQYENLPNFGAAPVTTAHASTNAGTAGFGYDSMVIPSVTLTSAGSGEIRLFNATSSNTTLTISGIKGDGSSAFQIGNGMGGGILVLPAMTVQTVTLDNIIGTNGVVDGDTISITLESMNGIKFSAQFNSVLDADQLSTTALGEAAQATHFSGVMFDPNNPNITDTISIVNPNESGFLRYRVDVLFADGSRINGIFVNLNALNRADLTVNDLPNAAAIIAEVNSDPSNSTLAFSIAVIDPNDSSEGAGLIYMTRTDSSMGFTATSRGRFTGEQTLLDFDGGGNV